MSQVYQKNDHGVVREFQNQGLRCQACDKPFKHELEVNIPVADYVKAMTSIKCPHCGSGKLYLGMGLSLSEDRALRTKQDSVEERLADWKINGETGASSMFVANHMLGLDPNPSAPSDYDDLRRVILLIDRMPEWADRMKELKDYPGWSRIAEKWHDIVKAVLAADPDAKSPKDAKAILEPLFQRT